MGEILPLGDFCKKIVLKLTFAFFNIPKQEKSPDIKF
jgi:hypothetical protein